MIDRALCVDYVMSNGRVRTTSSPSCVLHLFCTSIAPLEDSTTLLFSSTLISWTIRINDTLIGINVSYY